MTSTYMRLSYNISIHQTACKNKVKPNVYQITKRRSKPSLLDHEGLQKTYLKLKFRSLKSLEVL